MRIAVTLPSLPQDAPHRRAVDAVLAGLAASGVEVESFAEHDRLDEAGRRRRPGASSSSAIAGPAAPREDASGAADDPHGGSGQRGHHGGSGRRGLLDDAGREDPPGVPVRHYLRLAELHRERPFDAVLHVLGRDAPIYQSVYACLERVPGLVWVLDPVLHHLVLGDAAVRGQWGAYRRALQEALGDDRPISSIQHTVAGGWGTAALFRSFDLTRFVLRNRRGVVAAWPALAERLQEQLGEEVGVVPLPLAGVDATDASPVGRVGGRGTDASSGGRVGSDGVDAGSGAGPAGAEDSAVAGDAAANGSDEPPPGEADVAFLTVHPARPHPALDAARELLRLRHRPVVRFCVPSPVYLGVAAPAARTMGIHDRVEWVIDPSWERLGEVVRRSSFVVWLREDLVAGERMVLVDGMARGRPTFVPRMPLYEGFPGGGIVPIEPGRGQARTLVATISEMLRDRAFRDGIQEVARRAAADMPGVDDAVEALVGALEASARAGPPPVHDVAASTRQRLRTDLLDRCLPGGAAAGSREVVEETLRRAVESALPETVS